MNTDSYFSLDPREEKHNRIYSWGGLVAIKMWRALSVTTDLGYDSFLPFLISYNNQKLKPNFHDFTDANVSKICGFYFCSVKAPGQSPWSHLIKSGPGQLYT
jgi:hypothetical protein